MKLYKATCDVCGYTTTSKTQGLADYGLRKHNCGKQQAKNQRAADHAARMAQVDRTPKPCHHKRARHEHGTHIAYVQDRCRCNACREANTIYENQRAKRHAYGWFDRQWVPADETRAHIAALRAAGMGLRTIRNHSGVSESTLGKIVYGDPARGMAPSKRIRADTAQRILAVKPHPDRLAGGAVIDGTGTRRRLQALVWQGWSVCRLAEQAGIHYQRFHSCLAGRDVQADTARAVTTLYDHLWNQTPAHDEWHSRAAYSRAKNQARRNGWVGPLAWDDDSIDDPAATPDLGQSALRPGQTTRAKVHVEDIEFLLDQEPFTTHGIAARIGVTRNTIETHLRRADRMDLWDRMRRNETQEAAA